MLFKKINVEIKQKTIKIMKEQQKSEKNDKKAKGKSEKREQKKEKYKKNISKRFIFDINISLGNCNYLVFLIFIELLDFFCYLHRLPEAYIFRFL